MTFLYLFFKKSKKVCSGGEEESLTFFPLKATLLKLKSTRALWNCTRLSFCVSFCLSISLSKVFVELADWLEGVKCLILIETDSLGKSSLPSVSQKVSKM